MISLEKWKILTPLQKLPKNVGDLSKLIVDKGFEKLPKVQLIAQSGHTDCGQSLFLGFYFSTAEASFPNDRPWTIKSEDEIEFIYLSLSRFLKRVME